MQVFHALYLSRRPAVAFVIVGLFWGCFAAYVPQIKARLDVVSSDLVINPAIAATLLHVGHLAGDNPEEVGPSPNHHDQHQQGLSGDAGGEAFETSSLKTHLADATNQQNRQANQQNSSSRQLKPLPGRSDGG